MERFADRVGPPTLFKFRSFSDATLRARVKQILLEDKIYFSRASQLNDPFDLAPIISVTTDKATLFRDAEAAWRRANPAIHQSELDDLRQRLASIAPEEFRRDTESRVHARLDEQYWIFSLAGNRDHPLLWSHYAAGHTGLCIHFHAREPSPFAASQEVRYKSARPVLSVPLPDDQKVGEIATLRKGSFWKYEKEFRLIRYPHAENEFAAFGLSFDGPYAHFDGKWISGITVGAKMPTDSISAIKDMVRLRNRVIPIWKAEPTKTFQFDFIEVPL